MILLLTNCVGLPAAPKLDTGILNIEETSKGKYVLKAHFTNSFGTEWEEDVAMLQRYPYKHFIFRGDQMIDFLNWIDKVMITLKQEINKRK